MTPQSLAQLPMSALYRHFVRNPDAAFLAAQSGEDLAVLKTRCDQHWTRNTLIHSWNLRLLMGFALYGALLGLIMMNPSTALKGQDYFIVFVMMPVAVTLITTLSLSAVVNLTYFLTGWDRPAAIAEQLEPLRDQPFLCQSMVDVLESSTLARSYRDAVVAAGRELIVADVAVLYQQRALDVKAEFEARTRENCQRVHGLSAA